jgi:hypothetical protein
MSLVAVPGAMRVVTRLASIFAGFSYAFFAISLAPFAKSCPIVTLLPILVALIARYVAPKRFEAAYRFYKVRSVRDAIERADLSGTVAVGTHRSRFLAISYIRNVKKTAILVFTMVASQSVLGLKGEQRHEIPQGHPVSVIAYDGLVSEVVCSFLLTIPLFHDLCDLQIVCGHNVINRPRLSARRKGGQYSMKQAIQVSADEKGMAKDARSGLDGHLLLNCRGAASAAVQFESGGAVVPLPLKESLRPID